MAEHTARMLGVIVWFSKLKSFYHFIPCIVPQSISSISRILSVYKTLAVFSLECVQGSGCLHTLFCQCA